MPQNALLDAAFGHYPHLNPRRANVQPRDASGDAAALAEFGLSMAPGSGEAMAARDAWNASGRAGNALLAGNYGEAAGQYGNMLTAALGAIPGLGMVARGTQRGAAWMDRNLPAGVNKLLDYMSPQDVKGTLFSGVGPVAKTKEDLANEVEQAIRQRLADDPDSYYGLRVTETPLEVGRAAPPSKNWYQDFISEDHPDYGREAFPLHGTDLPGPSVVGLKTPDDIQRALKAAALLPSWNYYPGNHVSLIRGLDRVSGEDPGEWIIPNGEVVATWLKD
jgi:hypothetical protein